MFLLQEAYSAAFFPPFFFLRPCDLPPFPLPCEHLLYKTRDRIFDNRASITIAGVIIYLRSVKTIRHFAFYYISDTHFVVQSL